MNPSALEARVADHFRAHAAKYGLRASVRARYVLNWGGFVNASFTVTDGATSFHLKLTGDEARVTGLNRWRALREPLEARYRAPAMVDWVTLPGTPFQGPLFRHIAGHAPDLVRAADVRLGVLHLAAGLHRDQELGAALRRYEVAGSLADAFCGHYISRFDEDLAIVARELPAFVSPDLLAWMGRETRRLEALAHASAAFAAPTASPVHGDLHAQNVLVAETGEWYLLDWDDLALGDPAADYSVLLWPLVRERPPGAWKLYPVPGAADPAFAERMELYLRARLLDEVVDVLADWIDAATVSERREDIRAQKRREHEQALVDYGARYGE